MLHCHFRLIKPVLFFWTTSSCKHSDWSPLFTRWSCFAAFQTFSLHLWVQRTSWTVRAEERGLVFKAKGLSQKHKRHFQSKDDGCFEISYKSKKLITRRPEPNRDLWIQVKHLVGTSCWKWTSSSFSVVFSLVSGRLAVQTEGQPKHNVATHSWQEQDKHDSLFDFYTTQNMQFNTKHDITALEMGRITIYSLYLHGKVNYMCT